MQNAVGGAKRVCDSSGLFPEAIVIHALCRNSIIVLFTLSIPNSHVIFLAYISTSSYIVSGLVIMPPTKWGGGGEEREAERQEIQGGKKVNTHSQCVCVGGGGSVRNWKGLPHKLYCKQALHPWKSKTGGKTILQSKRTPLGNISDK